MRIYSVSWQNLVVLRNFLPEPNDVLFWNMLMQVNQMSNIKETFVTKAMKIHFPQKDTFQN
jgi:hypothetical protein